MQVQKGYASVLDGPGAMGGAINLVTRKPVKPLEAELSAGFGGRGGDESWNTYVMAGTRRDTFYAQGSFNYVDRDFWTLSGDYQPTPSSLQPRGRGKASYVKTKLYYNTFENGLDAFDDGTYTTQSAMGRFRSPYDDHAYGVGVETGTTLRANEASHLLKGAVHYRTDVHTEAQISRPTHLTLSTTEPEQEQSQRTWSVAVEDTWRLTRALDLVGGISYDDYAITKAQEFMAGRGLFEHPRGGADAFNWQTAVVWRAVRAGEWHASVSDRARFPVIFELYSGC